MSNIFHIACAICILSQYSQGTMEATREHRGIDTVADGYIAVRDCGPIGQVVWLRPLGQEQWEKFVVADCSMPPGTDGTWEWMTENKIVGEIDYETAARWGVVGRAARAQINQADPGVWR